MRRRRWYWLLGLWLAALIGLVVLNWSMRSYDLSQRQQEPLIATVNNPTTISLPKDGEIRVAQFNSPALPVNHHSFGWPRRIVLTYEGETRTFDLVHGEIGNTGIVVQADKNLTEKVYEGQYLNLEGYGWIEPGAGGTKCGTNDQGFDIIPFLDQIDPSGDSFISIQCWSDYDTGSEPRPDYNDYLVVLAYRSGDDGPPPSPSPSDDKQAKFVIRKFQDSNGNGVWESNESTTNRDWEFEYRLNADEWQKYQTAANTGWGGEVTVGLNTRVEVKEVNQAGWQITTTNPQTKILDKEQVYYFDFGNTPESAASFPPTQPDTGTPTWITVGVSLAALALLVIKLGLKL